MHPVSQQIKKNRSIEQLQFNKNNPRQSNVNPLLKNITQNQIFQQGKLFNLNNIVETKKSIIKINRKKLPLDFIMEQKVEPAEFNGGSKKQKLYKKSNFNIEKSQTKQVNNIGSQNENQKIIDNRLGIKQRLHQQNDKNSLFYKNLGDNKSDVDTTKKQVYYSSEKLSTRRNYQTRSEQKREKLQLQERNATAMNKSQKLDIFDILPIYRQKFQNQLNDMIVFTGVFNKQFKNLSSRTSPAKQMLTPIIEQPIKSDIRQIKKPNLKVIIKKRNNIQNYSSSNISEKQIPSPVKQTKEYKQINTPTITCNKYSQQNEAQSKNLSVTFYNTKSSTFPPINNK